MIKFTPEEMRKLAEVDAIFKRGFDLVSLSKEKRAIVMEAAEAVCIYRKQKAAAEVK